MSLQKNEPLAEFDPEIERTFHQRTKQLQQQLQQQQQQMQQQQPPQQPQPPQPQQQMQQQREEVNRHLNNIMAANNRNIPDDDRPLRDFVAPASFAFHSSIACPNVNANNFELKPALLSMVQQNQFGGRATEDPNLHLTTFLEYCDTLKINGASGDAIKLRLFPFSLRDEAKAWLHSMPRGSITSWDQLSQAFLAEYFPPSKTAQLRNQITNFAQRDGESLYEAWNRFKGLLRVCHHHGLEKWLTVQTFYNGLLYNTRITVDAAGGGALMNKSPNEAYNLIQEMGQNHH